MWYWIFGVIACLVESSLLYIFMYCMFSVKDKFKKIYWLFAVIDCFLVMLGNCLTHHLGVSFIICLLFECVILSLTLSGKIRNKILMIIFYNVFIAVVDNIVYISVHLLLPITFNELYLQNIVNSILTAISKTIMCCFIFIIIRWKEKRKNVEGVPNVVPFYIFPIVSIILFVVLYDYNTHISLNAQRISLTYIILVGVLLSNVVLLYFYDKLEKAKENEDEILLLKHQIVYNEELKSAYKRALSMKHDINKHLQMISTYLQNEKYDDMEKYLHLINNEMKEYQVERYTGNLLVDAIFSMKYYEAKERNIRFMVITEEMEKEYWNPVHMCELLRNALDNAIEACDRMEVSENKEISIKFGILEEKQELYFSVVNSSREAVTKDGEMQSSKRRGNHGIGLHKMNEVVKKMKGFCVYKYEDGKFIFIASIPIPTM